VYPSETTPDEAMAIFADETFDIIIVDLASSPRVKLDFIRHRSEIMRSTPLLALTGRHNQDRIRALALGANDAVTQPVDAGELRVRCAALVRRQNNQSRSLIQYGSLSLLLESRDVWYRNVRVFLTCREYSILKILVLHQGGLVTLDAIMKRLYTAVDEPTTRAVVLFITHLRKKLHEAGADGLIRNVRGQGYQLRKLGEPFPPPAGAFLTDRPTAK
jgi:DNA-binding response OmpR family regulator